MRERTPLPAEVLDRLPALELIVTTGGANASIDVAHAASRGITVCGTGARPAPPAEMTWALILALLRTVPTADRDIREGAWQDVLPGTELAGSTLGLIGLGRLGQRVARVAAAFEMAVLAWSQHLDPDLARGLGVDEKMGTISTANRSSMPRTESTWRRIAREVKRIAPATSGWEGRRGSMRR